MAEQIIYNMSSTGASDDLMKATETAMKMVKEWGMSDKVGPMAWGSGGQVFLGDEMMSGKDYSDETARVIDEETQRILLDAEDRCRSLLTTHRPILDRIATTLLENETVSGAEIDQFVQEARANGNGSSFDSAVATS